MKKLLNFSKEDLIKEIKNLRKKLKHNKYGLVWDKEREKEKVVLDCENNLPILNEIKKKEIKTDTKKPINILIEGDNYHALTCLNYTHKEKIDVIYIDPPYNNGEKVWKYNNNFVDKNDNYRHSKWLNMMEKRIKLAKNLLTKKGFFVIAIDHHELFPLGLLCDKIFREENRCGIVTVVHKPEGRQNTNYFNPSNEFMIIYKKHNGKFNKVAIDKKEKETFNLIDKKGFFKLKEYLNNDMMDRVSRYKKPDFWYPIYVREDLKQISLEKKEGYVEIFPITNNKKEKTWQTIKETTIERILDGEIIAKKKDNGSIVLYYKYREQQRFKTTWTDKKYNATANGTNLLSNIIGKGKFDFPKSLYTVLDTLKISSNKNSIVLDFFAGSGTTGHAVLKLNEEDNGNRQFILCTNNENKICEEVTYPRIKKVIKGYKKNGNGEKVEGLGGNLKYYKTDFVKVSSILDVNDKQREELTQKAGFLIAIKEKCYDEIYFSKYYQLFKNDKDKYVAIYFREDLEEWVEMEKKIKDKKTRLYIFSFGNVDKKLYKYLGKNIKIDDIPEPILEVYKEINLTYGKGEEN